MKCLLKDKDNNVMLPITRGELVLDSSGKVALHSEEFLATEEKPGLMSSSDKAKLDSVAGGAIDDKLDINSSNPVLNKVLTQIINSIKEKYLKSVSVINNKLTITDQDDNDVDFFGSIYSIVTDTTDGLVPKFDSVDGTIDDQSEDWILTNHKGNLGWYKLPLSTFTQNTTSLYIGDDVSESNTSTTNGSTYLKFFENSELKHKYKIQGSGSTVVTSDSAGNLNIYNPTTFASNQVDKLTDYVKGTSVESLQTTDTLNKALGKLECKADITYNLVKGAYDGDGTIENLEEILKVLDGIKDTETIQSIIGKYLPLSGGTMLGSITINHDANSSAQIIYKNNRLNDDQTGGWADNIIVHTNASGTPTARIGVLGDKQDLSYLFLGHNIYNATNNLRIYNDHASFGNNMIYNNYIAVPLILIIGDTHPHILGNNGILTLSGKNSLTEGSVVCDSENNAFRRNSASTNITLGTNTYRWGNFFGTIGNFTGKITFPLNTGIYYDDLYGLLGVASKGQWNGHPGNDNDYTFVGTPSYDTILRTYKTLLVYRDLALRTVVDSGNVSQFALPYIEPTGTPNANELLQNGIYNSKASITNAPVTDWGSLLSINNGYYTMLTYWSDSGSDMYIRRVGVNDSTKTTNWRRLLHTGDLNPSEVYTNSNQFCGYTTASNTDTRYYCICETTLPESNNLTLSFYISRTHGDAKQKGILQVHFRNDGGNLRLYDWSMPLNIGLNKSDFILTYKAGLIVKLYVKISGSWKSYECSVLTNSSWGSHKNYTKFYSSSSNSLTSLPSDETVVSDPIADCSVPLASRLANFYSVSPSNLKPAIIGDGSMYQFKSTSTASSLTDYPGDGHILHFEWDNNGGYSSQLFIRKHDGLLKTRGMNGKDANGNAKWGNWILMISTKDILLRSQLVFGPDKTDIQPTTLNNSFLDAPISIARGSWSYANNGYTSTPFGNIDLAGTTVIKVGENDSKFTLLFITSPTATEDNAIRGELLYYIDNGSSYSPTWYRVLTNSNYSNYILPRLESMLFTNNNTYVNATLVDPEVRKLALGEGHIEFLDSAVSPNTSGWFNSKWGKVIAVNGFEGGPLTLTGTTADTAKIQFSRSGATTWNYIIWPGNTSDSCLLAFGYDHEAAKSYYYMSNKALYPATNNTRSLGTNTMKWSNVYATTFTGNLEGKASKIALNRTDGGPTYGDYGEIIQSTSYGPTGSWHNSLKILHNNSAGYYTQLALTFTGEEGLWHRRCTNGIETEWKKVIDSSNIGSQSVSHATTTERFKLVISNSGDLNTALSSGGLARNYNSGMASGFTNAPTGSSYGMVLQLTAFANSNALAGQLAWDVNHNSTTDTTRYLWWRAGDSVSGFTKSVWHKIAFTDACLSINKKINIGGGSELVPITDIITKTGGYSLTKTLFYYAGNGYTTATKPNGATMANLDLAGASILTFGASDGEYTHLFITAPTQAGHDGITNEMLFYLNHGSDYSPGWTRVLTNRNYKSIVVGEAGSGTSDFSDGTEILTSYASDSGFSSEGYVNDIYKRKASSMFNYIKTKAAVDANAFTSYTSKYVKVYIKSDSQNYPILFAGGLGSSSGTTRGIYTDSVNSLYYNPSSNVLTSSRFASTVATGTAPMTISSTTVVSNLNADMVDGKHASDFAIPVGTIMMWAGSTAPTGWLLCNGAAVSRTTYSDLFAIISTTYGSGDGSTTFNVPNLQRRFPLGALTGSWTCGSQSYTTTRGYTGGERAHTLTVSEMPSHNHTLNVYRDDDGGGGAAEKLTPYSSGEAGSTASSYSSSSGYPSISNKGGSSSHNNIPPFLAVNFIIKY